MNKKTKKILIPIILVVVTYLVVAFAARDKNETYCNLSFGEYLPIKYCEANEIECVNPEDDFLCVNGVFDLTRSRNNKLTQIIELYNELYPIATKEERYKTFKDITDDFKSGLE